MTNTNAFSRNNSGENLFEKRFLPRDPSPNFYICSRLADFLGEEIGKTEMIGCG